LKKTTDARLGAVYASLPAACLLARQSVPLVRQVRGFKGYYLVDGGRGLLLTISAFDSADDALASNEKAAD